MNTPAVSAEQTLEFAELLAAAQGGDFPLGDQDETWDGGAAEKSYELPADANCWMWQDPDADPSTKAAYKFPFVDKTPDKHAVWHAITAIAGILQGAQGGAKIPDKDMPALKTKIAGYYSDAAKKYGDKTITPPWEADDSKGESAAMLLALAEMQTEASSEIRDGVVLFDGVEDLAVREAAMNEYAERLAHWQQEFASTPSDTTVCADGDCNHPAGMHGDTSDGDNMGACSAPGCDCDGFEMDDAASVSVVDELMSEITPLLAPDSELAARAALSTMLARYTLTFDTQGGNDVPLIDAHKPGSSMPKRHSSPRLPAVTRAVTRGDQAAQAQWTATLAPEGALTDDGRAFAPGSISWRDLPLTLMGLTGTSAEGGHDGAEVAGRIDNIWREGGLIKGSGVFDASDFGQEIARMVSDGTLRGISVDLAIHKYDFGPMSDWFDADGNYAPVEPDENAEPPSMIDLLFGDTSDEEMIFMVTDATLGMATACPFQAFREATIEPASSLVAAPHDAMWTVTSQAGYVVTLKSDKALTASAVAPVTEIPVVPPSEWFANPELDAPTALTVTDDGRIYGHAADWNTPHIAFPGGEIYAPHSKTDYAYYLLGEVVCADGERVPVGNITLGTGHAHSGLNQAAAAQHYDHTGTVVADVTCGEDEHGIWVAGALRSTVTDDVVRALRAAKLSGDWRNVEGNLELVATLAVNVPGFPIPRTRASVVASGETPQVVSLTAAGIVCGEACQAAFDALAMKANGDFDELAEAAAA